MKTVLKKKATNVLGKIVSKITESELKIWPPPCIGYFYQPKRPNIPTDILKHIEKNQDGKS